MLGHGCSILGMLNPATLNIRGFFWTAVIGFLFILMTKNSENNAGCMLARKWQMNPGMNAELLSTSLTKLLYSVSSILFLQTPTRAPSS